VLAHLYQSAGLLRLSGDWQVCEWSSAVTRLLQGDFGDVGPEDVIRNVASLSAREGEIVCLYESWRGGGAFTVRACFISGILYATFHAGVLDKLM